MIDENELRRLAEATDRDKWLNNGPFVFCEDETDEACPIATTFSSNVAAFIAAANPVATLELLGTISALRAEVERLKKETKVREDQERWDKKLEVWDKAFGGE